MKLAIFGLTVSSSWGNGHATLWRGLCSALGRRGHEVVFFERDVPYYANTRDLTALPGGGELILYTEWGEVAAMAARHLKTADVAMTTSYCPDALIAGDLIQERCRGLKAFYDLDAPVTLARILAGEAVDYVGPRGYRDYDLVLSYAGGKTLGQLQSVLGAGRVAPLYGSVDPEIHKPSEPDAAFAADMSYLGTYSADRDEALRNLFIEPARRLPERRFFLGGSMYGGGFPWLPNIFSVDHLPPARHPAFYCSSKVTLNVTRGPMAAMGFCPSGRLFEAAACGVPVFSDHWEGIETFYEPGSEILIGHTAEDAVAVVERSAEELARIGRAARERTLASHTSVERVKDLEKILEGACAGSSTGEVGQACGA
ncbi:MAG: glycosyltransferase [Acidobacteriota bacterium]|nr:glycosyltransferase [Acidobacteriota bacterium]